MRKELVEKERVRRMRQVYEEGATRAQDTEDASLDLVSYFIFQFLRYPTTKFAYEHILSVHHTPV